MVVHGSLLVGTCLPALGVGVGVLVLLLAGGCGHLLLLGVDLLEERLRDLVLDEVVPAVLLDAVLGAEERLAALVLAVVVLSLLHLAALEPAALAGVKVQEVVAPNVVGDLENKAGDILVCLALHGLSLIHI